MHVNTTIGFTNGVTRTFWLLANRAVSFPVRLDSKAEADELHRVAGVGSTPSTVGELFSKAAEMRTMTLVEASPTAGWKLLEDIKAEMKGPAAQSKSGRSYGKFD